MKKIYTLFEVAFLLICISLSSSCKKDKTAPAVSTEGITEITYTSAISGGIVTGDGGSAIVSRGICWNTSTGPTISNSTTNESGGIGAFTSNLTNLSQNTTYFVKAYAVNSVGTSYGNEVAFTTGKVAAPELTTAEITSILQRTAISGGNITNDNGGSVTTRGVCWSKITGPTIADSKTTDGTGTGSFVSNLTGLEGGTTYYVRSYAINSAGTSYGNELTFSAAAATLPVITSTSMLLLTPTTASSGGNITADGGSTITARGVCWSTSPNPTTANDKTTDGTGIGSFTSSMTGLTPGTTYYLKAYATNNAGTGYGDQVIFMSILSDVDQNIYKTVIIGTQVWMAENLKTTKYSNGDLIGTTSPATLDISLEVAPKYQWAVNNNESLVAVYGRLYTWYAATDSRNICPTGWHVPTDAEWTILSTFLGGDVVSGGKLKEVGLTHWSTPNTGATNESGFTAIPGGIRGSSGNFDAINFGGNWWSTTGFLPGNSWYRGLYSNSSSTETATNIKGDGFTIRCLKNN